MSRFSLHLSFMIKSTAPTRIDLAGGTLDIWPLHLHFGNPPTLNAAIDRYASVELHTRRDRAILVESEDLGLKERFSSVDSLPERHPLELILRTLKFYRPSGGLRVVTSSAAPPGSGIGGSSALNIALNGALNMLTGRRYSRQTILEIARNIETQVIRVPAGCQDYFPALYGGVLAVRPGITGTVCEKMPVSTGHLTQQMVLCYTGKPRQSGINNWEVFKNTLDGDRKTISKLASIEKVSRKMEQVLQQGNIEQIAPLLAQEWKFRKALAPGISTPHIEQLIRAAVRSGALAAKVCGAGGGGCVAFMVRRGFKKRVENVLKKQGAEVLPFRFVQRGLRVNKF